MTLYRAFEIFEDESGATAIEYGLIAATVAVGILVGLGALKTALNDLFQTKISDALK